ncbi:MAG: GAF domain-containing protein [Bacteroidota bacterium]
MRDAAVTKTLLRYLSYVDGLMVVVGVSVLVTGILVDAVVARMLSGVIVVAAAVYVTLSIRAKLTRREAREVKHTVDLPSNSPKKKRLFFDDFQPESSSKLVMSEESEEGTEDREPVAPSAPLGMGLHPRAHRVGSPVATATTTGAREFEFADFFDVNSELFKGETEPRTEFDFLLSKVLFVVKEVLFAHTVAFFWANHEKHKMVLEAKVTDSQLFMAGRRYDMGRDVVSQVAKTGKPEVISRINPLSEKDMVAYYSNVAFVRSFVGVPVFFLDTTGGRVPVAVLAVDSKAEDAFGQETVALLANFTKLISALIKSYTDKYDLLLDSEVLNAVRRMQQKFVTDRSPGSILNALIEETSRLISGNILSIVQYDDEKQRWIVAKILNRDRESFIAEGESVDLQGSLVGSVIRSNSYELVDDLESRATTLFHPEEKRGTSGSVVALPISSLNKCYGALCVLSRDQHNYTHREVRLLYRLVDPAAAALEIFSLGEMIKEHMVIDERTGLLNRKHFLEEVTKELQRSDDFGIDCSFVDVGLDDHGELIKRYGKDGFESIVYAIAHLIRSGVRPYDVVGLLDRHHVGVVLVNTTANDAYIWAEKIRELIASQILTVGDRTFSVTISVGICGATEGMTVEEFVVNATQVLRTVTDKGGNLVRVY